MSVRNKKILLPAILMAALTSTALALVSERRSTSYSVLKQSASTGVQPVSQDQLSNTEPSQVRYVQRRRLWPRLHEALSAVGDRLEKPGKERLTMRGEIIRQGETRPAPIMLIQEFPHHLRLEEQDGSQHRVTVFKERAPGGNFTSREADDIESLFYDTVEHFFSARMRGAATSFLGSNFRLDDGSTPNYTGPFYDIYQVMEPVAIGRQVHHRAKLYYFNSHSFLLERVRYRIERNGSLTKVEVLLSDWHRVQGQQVARRIVRLENGEPVLTLNITAVNIEARANDGLF